MFSKSILWWFSDFRTMSAKPNNPVTVRKRVTVLAHAKIFTKKIRKVNMVLEGPFIQQNHPVHTVSTSSPSDLYSQGPAHENDSVLSILN